MVVEERKREDRASARGNGLRACASVAKKRLPISGTLFVPRSPDSLEVSLCMLGAYTNVPWSLLDWRYSPCRLVRFPIDSGIGPAHRGSARQEQSVSALRSRARALPSSLRSLPCVAWNQHGSGIEARTRERIALEPERVQARQIADRLGNRACTPRERATGTIRERSPFPSSRAPQFSPLSPV